MPQPSPEHPQRTTPAAAPHWQIERIDNDPMTTTQYDAAVVALAALITAWTTDGHDSNTIDDRKAA